MALYRLARLKTVARTTYKHTTDLKCRFQVRSSPVLLEKLATRLAQSRQLYLLNLFARGGQISKGHTDKPIRVHRGRKWRVLTVTKWHLGSTWGSLARTRRVAAFKAKAANKKRKKVSKGAQLISEMKILQFRALQLGQKRRTSTRASVELETQMRSLGV